MKARITIDIRKKDYWGLVTVEFENTRRYFQKNIDLHGFGNKLLSNEGIVTAAYSAIDEYLDNEMFKELEEEDRWTEEMKSND